MLPFCFTKGHHAHVLYMQQSTVVGYVCLTNLTVVTSLGSAVARLAVALAATQCVFVPAAAAYSSPTMTHNIHNALLKVLQAVGVPLLHNSDPTMKPLFKF